MHCRIFTDGQLGWVNYMPNDVKGGGTGGAIAGSSMPKPKRDALDAAIGRLPPDQPFHEDVDAFFVSWNENGIWCTRTYDHRTLPREIRALCELFGMPAIPA